MALRTAARVGGVLGPAMFLFGWIISALRTDGYSVIEDAISRLAAVGAPTRWLMSAGFIGFTVGVAVYSYGLRSMLDGPAWIAALIASIATLGVALFPLDHSSGVDLLHGAAAFTGYIALSALPLYAAPELARRGLVRAARLSRVCGTISSLALAATLLGPAHGLFQRIGVTVGDAWIAGSALWLLPLQTPARRTRAEATG